MERQNKVVDKREDSFVSCAEALKGDNGLWVSMNEVLEVWFEKIRKFVKKLYENV